MQAKSKMDKFEGSMCEIATKTNRYRDDNKERQWYALYTRSRFEKKVHETLIERGVHSFLPLISEVRQWKNGKKKVDFPLFPGYVFVNIHLSNRLDVLSAKGSVRLVGFGGKPVAIPSEQIESVRRVFENSEQCSLDSYISIGKLVEITGGPLAGVKGRLMEYRGQRRVLIGIELIQQAVSVEVQQEWILQVDSEGVFNSLNEDLLKVAPVDAL